MTVQRVEFVALDRKGDWNGSTLFCRAQGKQISRKSPARPREVLAASSVGDQRVPQTGVSRAEETGGHRKSRLISALGTWIKWEKQWTFIDVCLSWVMPPSPPLLPFTRIFSVCGFGGGQKLRRSMRTASVRMPVTCFRASGLTDRHW